jgi:ornithine cyclodeaminase/alanine dehydrogenase-like protein (mu-crystallin family)
MLRVINGSAVRELYPIAEAIPDMEGAMTRFSAGEAYQHPRVAIEPPGEGGLVLLMPAMSGAAIGLKVLSMFPKAPERGLPGVQGILLLIDAVHGEPLAVVDGIAVTEVRTAAVTALATARMAPPDATSLGFIGAGVQAKAHLAGLAQLQPWKSIRVFSRTAQRAERLAAWAADSLGLTVDAVGSPAAAVRGADVVCTVTSASEPVLADADIAERATHVNAIGAFGPTWRELPTAVMARSRIVVDSREAALAEAGDVLIPIREGALTEDMVVAELGEVLAGRVPGRVGDEVSVFKSLGLPIQDAVACETIYRRAVERGMGEEIAFP